jgi:hypothetical protein
MLGADAALNIAGAIILIGFFLPASRRPAALAAAHGAPPGG